MPSLVGKTLVRRFISPRQHEPPLRVLSYRLALVSTIAER